MSYQQALEAAGATVHVFQEFGSYQGDWWAKVTFNGKTGWIHDYYGSCSGCDAFEAEFGWNDEENDDYQERLAKFGKEYLDEILDQETAEAKAAEALSWDLDAEEMVKFVKDNTLSQN